MGGRSEIRAYYVDMVRIWPLHKSSPMASWDSKASVGCTLQNLTGKSGPFWDFFILFVSSILTYIFNKQYVSILLFGCTILHVLLYMVGLHLISFLNESVLLSKSVE